MAEFVSANISLAYGAVQFMTDFNFSHIKVDNDRDPISGTTSTLCAPIFIDITYCSDKQYDSIKNDTCGGYNHEKILFGRKFPQNLPVFLFKNKKDGDKIEFVYGSTKCTFTLTQGPNSVNTFEEALVTAFKKGIKYAKDTDKAKIKLVSEEHDILI